MNKLFATILVVATSFGVCNFSSAATAESKATYKAAKDSADGDYKIARAKCDSLSGNPKDVCIEEAKAVRDRTKAEAEATYKGTVKARASARKTIAEADYDVAKEKCKALTGNDKDVCIKEAKSAKIAAVADAKADKKVVDARTDAREDKKTAEYKVALEKCDAMAGTAKSACVDSAKKQYGK